MPSRYRSHSPSRRATCRRLLAGALTFCALTLPVGAQTLTEHAVIVSPDVEISNLSSEELARIFTFRQIFWKPGQRVSLVFSDRCLEENSFFLTWFYDGQYSTLRRLVFSKLYQGEIALAPTVLATDATVIAAVAQGRGLIGFVHHDQIGDTDVRVLKIDGLSPQSSAYPLRR